MKPGSIGVVCALAALALSAAPPAPAASARGPVERQEEAAEKKEPERLKAWPAVDEEAIATEIDRLRKARTDTMGDDAHAKLLEAGAGVVPLLLPKLGVERDEGARKRIVAVLDGVTGAPHTRLLAAYFDDRSAAIRSWSLRRVAAFPDVGVRPAAEKAVKAAEKRGKREPDREEECFAAALCAASAGSFVGFDAICERAVEEWGEDGSAIHVALCALRGEEATKRIAPLLADQKPRREKVTALRLLAACGEGDLATALVRPLLDSTDNSLRVAAINALRGIVDGDPPLDKLSVFEAIERANKWKARLG